jgi:phosphate transport system permease protein
MSAGAQSVGIGYLPPVVEDTESKTPYGPSSRHEQLTRLTDFLARSVAFSAAASLVVIIVALVYFQGRLAWPSITTFGWSFLWSTEWDANNEKFGVLPFLVGTVVSSVLAILIAAPFGIGTALFLTELAPRNWRSPIGFLVEMLGSIPSVVYGLVGIFILAPVMANSVGPFLNQYFGWTGLFSGRCHGVSLLTAAVILAIMIVPFIAAISREILRQVPRELKDGSYALGATKWETIWHVVLPHARVGIGGGVIMALGRALGETMAVAMVIGNSTQLPGSLLDGASSMASVIAMQFSEAGSELYLGALVHVGLVLFCVAVVMNLIARYFLSVRPKGVAA